MAESQIESLLYRMRHSCAHVLAQAVLEMFPEAKLAIGPAIENGFYYDFDLPRTLIPEDLPLLEEKMKKIQKEKQVFKRYETSLKEALEFFKKTDQQYKVEILKDLKKEGEKKVSFYENVDGEGKVRFVDLCKGPHLENTGQLGAFALSSIAGAYWRGEAKNKMLQRIYGFCFESKEQLEAHLKMLAEAKKRDHRELGARLDLFSFHEEGPGFPFWHPKGMIVYNELVNFCREMRIKNGFKEIRTPLILREDLWHRSGHYDNYRENMYFTPIDEENYAIKPMNCPGGSLVYGNSLRSYRDLPLRLAEFGMVHRHEKSGVLHGLFRVRNFTQDDAHIYCTPDQITAEIKNTLGLCDRLYKVFGFSYRIELSTRPEKYVGSLEIWEQAEKTMKAIMEELHLECKINEGDGAFYGPKFDFHVNDCIGRSWQCGTVQLDFSMPERFNLEYIGEDGKKHRPVMIHNAIYGSLERFIGILTEHFAGAFPLWIAPVQIQIIPVSEKHLEFCAKLAQVFKKEDFRGEVDESNESVGKKIRNAELMKIPYMLVIGDKEAQSEMLTVRRLGIKEQWEMVVKEFEERVSEEILSKV